MVQEGFFSPREPVLQPGINDVLLQAYLDLLDLGRNEPIGFQQLAAAMVHRVLALTLATVAGFGHTQRDEQRVRQAKAFLEENVEGRVSIPTVAATLHISPEHLRRLFRRNTGMSPNEFYIQLKMNQARQLLRETNLPLKQIAHTLGFESQFHFSKAFKQRTGMPPAEWRSQSS